MKLKLIIVDPKYQMNAGYVARIAKNFGITQLNFVSPRANIRGNKAVMYSKHAVDLLRSAKTYGTFEDAIADCTVVLGTSGILRSNSRFSNTLPPEIARRKVEKEYRSPTVALVIGRDDTGLNFEELEKCDMLVHINSNKEYPVLNISHALAVLLYEFTKGEFSYGVPAPEQPSAAEVKALLKAFDQMTKDKKIRSKEGVRNIFSKMVRRSQLNRHEVHALITAFK